MLVIHEVICRADDPVVAEMLHEMGHDDKVEYLTLSRDDAQRHRLRASTDRGTECAIALPRDVRLFDGAVISLDDDRAIVVRLAEREWLRLEPRDTAAALELGYHAGNSHWVVRFDGPVIAIALQSDEQTYLDRLSAFFSDGRVKKVDDGQQ